ncbi:MAG: PD-(D/E)XK nuclease family protein [Bacteroidales bacterium]
MEGFLHKVAQQLYTRHGDNIRDLSLVFPSARSRLYFSEHLSQLIEQPIWQPKMCSMDDVFARITGLQILPQPLLVAMLYECYMEQRQCFGEGFDNFYYWGEVMLADFDALDKYLVKVDPLLRNLKAIKDYKNIRDFLTKEQEALIEEFWGSLAQKGGESDKLQSAERNTGEKFKRIWEVLLPTYNAFNEKLLIQGKAYAGMMYRKGIELLRNGYNSDERFVFIGFNALSRCEKKLFQYLKKAGKAEFFWDYDAYYLNDKTQEAGYFLRDYIKQFPPMEYDETFSPLVNTQKDIQIVATSSSILQAKILPQMLAEMCGDESPDSRTAIIFADEGLLIPSLYSLPQNIDSLNITMGYPMAYTPVYSLIELVVKLQKNIRVKEEGAVAKFYHKDVLAVLQHSYIVIFGREQVEQLQDKILQDKRIYLSAEDLQAHFSEDIWQVIAPLFIHYNASQDFGEMLCNLLTSTSTKTANSEQHSLQAEYALQAYKGLNQLNDALQKSSIKLGMSTYLNLVRNTLRSLRLPFEGEPIAGLQLMGMLETRALDFDNLIILSLNEDIFPQSSTPPSLIPHNLRVSFSLPVIDHHHANYAYTFYRLLQRAKQVRLLYSNQTTDTMSGEMSRYLLQLKLESGRTIPERSITYKVSIAANPPITINKDEAVQQMLARFIAEQGGTAALSASSINTYLSCPIKFYFSKLAKIRESEQLTDIVSPTDLGNIFHAMMEEIYQPLLEKSLTKEDLLALTNRSSIESLSSQITARVCCGSETNIAEVQNNGKLWLLQQTVIKFVLNTLHYDALQTPLTIKHTELEMQNFNLAVNINGVIQTVRVGGIIDRVDTTAQGLIRVVDYKTAASGDNKTRIDNIADLFDGVYAQQRPEVVQLLLYALYMNKTKGYAAVDACLYFVRGISQNNGANGIWQKEGKGRVALDNVVPLLAEFEQCLCTKLADLFNPLIAFVQTKEQKACEYCAYAPICRR